MVLLSGVDNRLRRASHPPAPDTASVRPTRLREPRYVRLSLLGRGCDTVARGSLAGCPSGQRERSVKPSAMPTVVRIHYPPPPARTTPDQRKCWVGVAVVWSSSVPLRPTEARYPWAHRGEGLGAREAVDAS